MNYSKKIYKLDSKKKLRVLHVYTEGDTLFQESGLVDGNLVIHESICKPKNIGKTNETTAEEQALAEANSKVINKMSTGYFNTKDEAEESNVILPMLAKSFDKEGHKVEYPCYVQPKLDGMRALGFEDKLLSRKGKEIDTVTHILDEIKSLNLGNIILDGELYVHGETFQDNMRLIKKYRSGETENVKYHVYDIVNNEPFITRFARLEQLVSKCEHIVIVPTICVINEEEIKRLHSKSLSMGYEGTIIRWGYEPYKINGRSSHLLKNKDFFDLACNIVDVVPSEKRPEQGQFICEHEDQQFGCGMRFSHTERCEILENKADYIGQTAEIRFFEFSEDNVPRFPVCVGLRSDK